MSAEQVCAPGYFARWRELGTAGTVLSPEQHSEEESTQADALPSNCQMKTLPPSAERQPIADENLARFAAAMRGGGGGHRSLIAGSAWLAKSWLGKRGERRGGAVWCGYPGAGHLRSQAHLGCPFWQREPGADDE